jgi:proteasome component ECM29
VDLSNVNVVETLRFLRTVWLHEALEDTFRFDDENWRDRLEAAVEVDDSTRSKIKAFLSNWMADHNSALDKYFGYLRQILSTGNEDQLVLSANLLLELVSLGGKELSAALVPDMNAIRELVFSRNELLRVKSAELLGIICGEISTSVESMIVGLLRFAEGSVERQHGAVIAVGSIIGRLSVKGTLGTVSAEVLNKFVSTLSQLIESPNTNTLLLESCLQALSSLCIFGAGTLLQTSQREAIIVRLQNLSKSSRHGNLQDRAVLTLGYLSFSLKSPDDEPMFNRILDALYAIHEQKQVELNFSVGEALSCVAARWNSKAMAKFRDAQTDMNQSPPVGLLDRVLNAILEYVRSPKHPLRKVLSYQTLLI